MKFKFLMLLLLPSVLFARELKDYLLEISSAIPLSIRGKRLAVINFYDRYYKQRRILSKEIESIFSGILVDKFKVVERERIKDIIKVLQVEMQPIFDESTVVKIGKLAGAELLLTGDYKVDEKEIILRTKIIELKSGIVEFDKKIELPRNCVDYEMLGFEKVPLPERKLRLTMFKPEGNISQNILDEIKNRALHILSECKKIQFVEPWAEHDLEISVKINKAPERKIQGENEKVPIDGFTINVSMKNLKTGEVKMSKAVTVLEEDIVNAVLNSLKIFLNEITVAGGIKRVEDKTAFLNIGRNNGVDKNQYFYIKDPMGDIAGKLIIEEVSENSAKGRIIEGKDIFAGYATELMPDKEEKKRLEKELAIMERKYENAIQKYISEWIRFHSPKSRIKLFAGYGHYFDKQQDESFNYVELIPNIYGGAVFFGNHPNFHLFLKYCYLMTSDSMHSQNITSHSGTIGGRFQFAFSLSSIKISPYLTLGIGGGYFTYTESSWQDEWWAVLCDVTGGVEFVHASQKGIFLQYYVMKRLWKSEPQITSLSNFKEDFGAIIFGISIWFK